MPWWGVALCVLGYTIGGLITHNLRFWLLVHGGDDNGRGFAPHEICVMLWPGYWALMAFCYMVIVPILMTFDALCGRFSTRAFCTDTFADAVLEKQAEIQQQREQKQLRASVADLPVPGAVQAVCERGGE
jgi:hypothetical protein